MEEVDDGGGADGHEDGQSDVFDAHDPSPVLVPGGQQVGAQHGIWRVGEGGQEGQNQVGDERPGRHGRGLVVVNQRGGLILVAVKVTPRVAASRTPGRRMSVWRRAVTMMPAIRRSTWMSVHHAMAVVCAKGG